MVPTKRAAAPRGMRVSESRVITYLTSGIAPGARPPVGTNVVLEEPLKRRFNS